GEVVATPGLIVDDGDDTTGIGAERILRGGVGKSACAQDADVQSCVIRGAPDLIQVSAIRAVEGAHRAMGSHTGRAARCIQVAGLRSGGVSRCRRRAKYIGDAQCSKNETQNSNESQNHFPTASMQTLLV